MSVDMSTVRSFIALHKEKARLTAELDTIKAQIDLMEGPLVTDFQQDALQNVKMEDRVVFVRSEVWASIRDGSHDAAVDVLREIGEGDLVKETVNSQTLSRVVRGWLAADGIPPELEPHITVTPKTRLGVQKTG